MAGGVAAHTISSLQQPPFVQHFHRKDRLSELLMHIPIHVIITPAALTGAAVYGLENSIALSGSAAHNSFQT